MKERASCRTRGSDVAGPSTPGTDCRPVMQLPPRVVEKARKKTGITPPWKGSGTHLITNLDLEQATRNIISGLKK